MKTNTLLLLFVILTWLPSARACIESMMNVYFLCLSRTYVQGVTKAPKAAKNTVVANRRLPIICSLGEEPLKLSIKVPRQRFWLTCTFLLETISGLIIKIPLIRTKDILALGFELNFNNNQTPVAT